MTIDERVDKEAEKAKKKAEACFSKIKPKVEEATDIAPELSRDYNPKTVESCVNSQSTDAGAIVSDINAKMNVYQEPAKPEKSSYNPNLPLHATLSIEGKIMLGKITKEYSPRHIQEMTLGQLVDDMTANKSEGTDMELNVCASFHELKERLYSTEKENMKMHWIQVYANGLKYFFSQKEAEATKISNLRFGGTRILNTTGEPVYINLLEIIATKQPII